ncbi:MAG: permease [Candidatus Wolfebacteria bacterium]|nr:permease [Candidatus Wolfebacteria bacterium]
MFYPIQIFADWLTYVVLNIVPGTKLGAALDFFVFDTIKIFILLAVIVFVVSIIRSFLPAEKVRKMLSHKREFTGNILSSFLGILTPFCTCSAIPLFLGFVQAGVPLGVTFSFLVASPMINEVALVMLLGLFGWKIATIYITSGLIIAILSGIVIGRMKPEHLVESFVFENSIKNPLGLPNMTWKARIQYARDYTWDIVKKVWLYIIIGIGVGAWIHGYVPMDFLAQYAGSNCWYAVPLAVLVGIPLYSNAAGVIPLVSALTEKGVSIGTTLAFMMAVTGLSLPEFMILKKVMKVKLIVIFAAIVGIGIIFTGYLFNAIL